jgi:acyl-homoserine-lactone acylase
MRITTLAIFSLGLCIAAESLSGHVTPPLDTAVTRERELSADVKWDTYGVPHIVASTNEAAFYAFGWAQMRSHGNLLLDLYGKARGRAAEYWGPSHLDADVLVQKLEIPQNAQAAYAAQDAEFKRYVDRFVAGMNAYAASNPSAVKPANRAVLPLVPTDVFAHLQSTMELGFIGRNTLRSKEVATKAEPTGSNAFAIAASRSASRRAMLVGNPHLPWNGFYTFYEAHLRIKGRDFYGATLIGLPVLTLAFNDTLGWTHTSNYVDGADLYEVAMRDDDHYTFGGKVLPLRKRTHTFAVREGDALQQRTQTIAYTVQGPVMGRTGEKAYAYRSTRALYPRLFKQYWQMVQATNLAEFNKALQLMQIPLFNIIYADRAGHIMYRWNGLLPQRTVGDAKFWGGTVPGHSADTLWTRTFGLARLPHVIDPPSGWLQNSNDAPWTSTWPALLHPSRFPVFVTPAELMELRSQQIVNVLSEASRQPLTFDAVKAIKFTNRMELADRVLDELLRTAEAATFTGERGDLLTRARGVLAAWDRTVDADSRGAVLFRAWVQRMTAEMFAEPSSFERPLSSPRGLKNPAQAVERLILAAEHVTKRYGALDVKWGDVYRLQRGTFDAPASGGPSYLGIFHTIEFREGPDGRFYSRSGESFSSVVEFSTPLRAEVLLSYGNSSEDGSPHNGDQLALVARKQMRRALLTDGDIDQHLSKREVLTVGAYVP